jgi:hypothetical protein
MVTAVWLSSAVENTWVASPAKGGKDAKKGDGKK